MFYRFLGRIFLYFWIIPFMAKVGKYVFTNLVNLSAKNINNPGWTMQKELSKLIGDRLEKLMYGENPQHPPRNLADELDEQYATRQIIKEFKKKD